MRASIDAGSGAGFVGLGAGVGVEGVGVDVAVSLGPALAPAYAVGLGPAVPPPRASVCPAAGPAVEQAPSSSPAVRPVTRALGVRTSRVSPGTARIPSPLPAFVPVPRPPSTDDRWSTFPPDMPYDTPGTARTAYQRSSVGGRPTGSGEG